MMIKIKIGDIVEINGQKAVVVKLIDATMTKHPTVEIKPIGLDETFSVRATDLKISTIKEE